MAKKKIERQVSDGDIYNIQGNFNLNGGGLNVENLILENSQGLEAKLLKAEQEKRTASFSISYIDFLRQAFENKTLIERPLVKSIWKKLTTVNQLMISGDPGSGKTCILFQLSSLAPEAIYFSVRNRSPLNVLNHLINRIRTKQNDVVIAAISIEEAFDILEGLLQSSEMHFFIDDCEADTELVSKLISLHKGANLFIFASRNALIFDATGVETFPIFAFTEDETKVFLSRCGIELDILSFNKLYHASNGNPLYLFYFSKYQVKPLPTDINNYHKAIWAGLSPEEHECLIYISLGYRRLCLENLSQILGDAKLIDTAAQMEKLASLVNNQKGRLEIFHPTFKEYILERLRTEGMLTSYSEKMGLYFLSNKKLVEAAWLLIDSQPEKVNSFGINAVPAVIISGDLHFAVKLITSLLNYKKTFLNGGYLQYHLACVYRFLHQEILCEDHLEKAIVLFKKLKDKHWLLSAEMVKAMNFVEKGRNAEGLALADSIFIRSEKFGDAFKATNLVNLTKIYIDLSEYQKGARAAKEAFDIFEKLNNRVGMVSSLANLSSCLAKLDDYSDLAETYAIKLLNLTTGHIEFTIRLIALNILTSVNRQNGKFTEAKKYGDEAIKLCQKYDLPDKLILNLINYGNIIRDEKNSEGAIKIYEEALARAKDLGLKKDEGRVYWILSSIFYEVDELDKSIDFANKSIDISRQINYSYGVAHALEEKAKAMLKNGDKLLAAEAYEESAKIFLTIENFSKNTKASFSKAILLYFEMGLFEKANNLLALSIMDVPHNNFEEIDHLIKKGRETDLQDTIHQSYLKLALKYADQGFTQNTIRKFMVYLDYCHRNSAQSKGSFLEVLTALATNVGRNRFALTNLAILVEQSRNLLGINELNKLIQLTENGLSGFHFRLTVDESVMLASVTDVLKIQVNTLNDDLIAKKLSFAAILFLFAAPELVSSQKKAHESFYKMFIIDFQEIINEGRDLKIPKKEFSEHIQTLMLLEAAPGAIDSVYINTEYEEKSDLIKYPNNKCLMYLLGIFVMQLTTHFYKEKKGLDKKASKYISRKIAYFFDYTNIEEIKNLTEEFGINLEKFK